MTAHWRIVFNGNGYDSSWIGEAEKRGLLNLKNTPEAMAHYLDKKNIKLYTEMGVYTEVEMQSHYDIKLEKYCQVLNIEVQTMLEMIYKDILPATFNYINAVSQTAINLKTVVPSAKATSETVLLSKLDELADSLLKKAKDLEAIHASVKGIDDIMAKARGYADKVMTAMADVRAVADEIEPILGEGFKPYPCYEDLLFRI